MMQNFPQVIENAIRATMRQYCPVDVESEWVRCSQSQNTADNEEAQAIFPQVYISAGGKYRDGNEITWQLDFSINCFTDAATDRTAAQRASIYGSIEGLFENFLPEVGNREIIGFFENEVRNTYSNFKLGGFVPLGSGGASNSGEVLIMEFAGRFFFTY